MHRRRPLETNLSAGERRVLDAFHCGRITAGQLSGALAHARRLQQPAPEPLTGAAAGRPPEPVAARLQLAA